MDTRLQRFGGAASLAFIGAIVIQLAFFFVYLPSLGFSMSDMTGDVQAQLRLLSAARGGFIWESLVLLAVFAFMFVFVHALYVRLRLSAPVLSPLAAVFGYASWGLLIMEQVRLITLAKTMGIMFSAEQVTYLSPMFDALRELIENGAALMAVGWVLLVSVAALRNRELTRPVAYLGIAVAASELFGMTGIVPIDTALDPFLVLWLLSVGVVLLARPSIATSRKPTRNTSDDQVVGQHLAAR